MGRPIGKHIDNAELNALVPTPSETGREEDGLSPAVFREALHHAALCPECSGKLQKYLLLVNQFSIGDTGVAPQGVDCPTDVDWYEVALGLWPEYKATQLLTHAALCDHCGPLLRAATRLDTDPTPQEEKLLATLKTPSRPALRPTPVWRLPLQQPLRWLTAGLALIVIAGVLTISLSLPLRPLSAQRFAEIAVATHRQHTLGSLALDVRSDSQQTLNDWFRTQSPFSLALPARPAVPGEERPYHLVGARLIPVSNQSAIFIAYQVQTSTLHTATASLMVARDSLAIASGGTEARYKKVTFHYSTVEGYKAVTWSQHGLTYALVSDEGNRTQLSCMVCHSAMRDRDLSQVPTPLHAEKDAGQPALQ